jgi:DNA processing protein
VTPLLHLTPLDPTYPSRLRALSRPPASLTVRGGPLEAPRAVAIVGSRQACGEAVYFSRCLAAMIVRSGAVVVSGGALGIDAAAHRGALEEGGRTWAVAGTGCEHCFPSEHASLFDAIGAGPGAMVWPFPPASAARAGGFVLRNRVLVALSDAVIVAQAGCRSGALRAAECARALNKPLWVVPAPPWAAGFEGSRILLEEGVRPLTDTTRFLKALELSFDDQRPRASSTTAEAHGPGPLDPIQSAVLCATSSVPIHLDEIAQKAHATVQAAAAALLTLALEAVVVEGPPGFYRRRDSHKS